MDGPKCSENKGFGKFNAIHDSGDAYDETMMMMLMMMLMMIHHILHPPCTSQDICCGCWSLKILTNPEGVFLNKQIGTLSSMYVISDCTFGVDS